MIINGFKNHVKKLAVASFVAQSLVACGDDSSSEPAEEILDESSSSEIFSSSDFAKSSARNSSSSLSGYSYAETATRGLVLVNDTHKKVELENSMKVNLDYDFYIGKSEVTCGDFYKTSPHPPTVNTACPSDSLPVGGVSFFDIVLYLNAKSVLNNLDTAYTYTGILFDTEGHVLNLEGLAYHNDANGFRLPTEAEWTYVASKKWDPSKSWNSGNSGFTSHNVCSNTTDSLEFCDFAGNVGEWANDWFAPLFDTTVTNYTGAPDGGTIGKRVVKGGAYNTAVESINLFSRNDIYTITSSTHANYIGFRIALGKIPNPTWFGAGKNVVASRTIPLASATVLKNIYKTYNIKLVFRNDVSQTLSLIKYNEDIAAVLDINDTIDAYHPDISPDGKYVAFCTGIEGVSGKSKIYVRNLNETEIKHEELLVDNAAIPRWRVLENGDTVITYVSDAGNNKNDATFASTSTWQVRFEGGKFGTPEKLFDGAYHGGISEDEKFAVTGARLLRARINDIDTIWFNGEQACNASLAMDGTKRTAFLDFAGKTGIDFTGTSYAAHEYLFVADSTGKLIKYIKAPAGYTFDHIEWASDGNISNIIATLADLNGAHTKIVLVNAATGQITELAQSDELWHPDLWIQQSPSKISGSTVQTDSAGIYFISGYPEYAIQWRYKMELFWQFKDSANTVILGSSRSHYGIVPENITAPDFAINMACPFNVNYGVHFLFKNYIVNHMSKLKNVIIGIDLDRFLVSDESNFFKVLYRNLPGYMYDERHEFWPEGAPAEMYELTHGALGLESYATHLLPTRGFDDGPGYAWPITTQIVRDTIWTKEDSITYYSSFNYLKETIKLAHEHNIRVIGVELPYNPRYRNTGSYCKEGLQRSKAVTLLQEIADLSKTYPNFVFYDANQMGNHDFEGDVARDSDHLGHLGALRVTTKIDSVMKNTTF